MSIYRINAIPTTSRWGATRWVKFWRKLTKPFRRLKVYGDALAGLEGAMRHSLDQSNRRIQDAEKIIAATHRMQLQTIEQLENSFALEIEEL